MVLAKMHNILVSSGKVLQAPPSSSDLLPNSGESSSSQDVQSTAVGPTAGNALTRYKPGKADIFLLGITIVIGGEYFDWNGGVQAGAFSFIIAYFLIGVGYLLLTCCIAEINGALPFAGGAYGLARCTLGFYPAFMIGCCDITEYIVYVSASVISFAELIVGAAPSLAPYHPLTWAIFYVAALAITIKGDRVFWIVSGLLGVLSIFFLVLFCFGSLPYVNFSKYAAIPDYEFIGGFRGFMLALPHAAWFFVGIEALSLACDQIDAPKKVIPVAQLSCISIVFVTGVMVVFVTLSLAPGVVDLPTNDIPFNLGFTQFLGISNESSALLSLPGAFGTAFGFMWAYGKLIAALSTSKLLFPVFARTTASSNTPYNALLIGSAWSYALCILVYFLPQVGDSFVGICMLSAAMSYSGQCIGYIALKRNYRNIKSSEFRSPFGIAGAICSLLVWILMATTLLTIHDDGGIDAMGFALIVIFYTLFYFCYARKRQTFSPQENKIMLVAHVTKFNIKKVANRQNRRQRKGSGSSSHAGNGTETSLSERARNALKERLSFSAKSSGSRKLIPVSPLSVTSTGSAKLLSPAPKP
ncbi:putative transporter [Phytophthora cinnamomi]|uniref:putative transporter n=1 Tax=Phytophthora cinnamomi TaxID=4785 RepID=UPI00355940DA|nr:putative transporter [Phytophthora cinnamomi]